MGVITAKLNDTRKIANFFAFTTTAVVVLLTTQVFLGCGPLPMEGYQQENRYAFSISTFTLISLITSIT